MERIEYRAKVKIGVGLRVKGVYVEEGKLVFNFLIFFNFFLLSFLERGKKEEREVGCTLERYALMDCARMFEMMVRMVPWIVEMTIGESIAPDGGTRILLCLLDDLRIYLKRQNAG